MSVWQVSDDDRDQDRNSGQFNTCRGMVRSDRSTSQEETDQTALPMQVTQFDFEDKLFIKGLVLEEERLLQWIMMQRLLKKMELK